MSGKSGKRETGNKPSGSTRTSAKTDGAFGKEQIDQTVTETERNVDRSVAKNIKLKK
jgi:hypothetical protein